MIMPSNSLRSHDLRRHLLMPFFLFDSTHAYLTLEASLKAPNTAERKSNRTEEPNESKHAKDGTVRKYQGNSRTCITAPPINGAATPTAEFKTSVTLRAAPISVLGTSCKDGIEN